MLHVAMTKRKQNLKGQCHKIFCFWMGQYPPSPRVSHKGRFEFVRKFSDIFTSHGAPPVSTTAMANLPPVSTTLAANFATSFASVVDTEGKIWKQYQAADSLK